LLGSLILSDSPSVLLYLTCFTILNALHVLESCKPRRSKGLIIRRLLAKLAIVFFKVYQLISSYESPRSRIKQVLELARVVDELGRRVSKLSVKLSELSLILG